MTSKPTQTTKPKRPKTLPFSHKEKRTVSSHGHMIREAFQSDRKPKKPLLSRERTKRGGVLWGTFMLWTVLISVTVFTVFFSDFHVIRSVAVNGTQDVSPADIEAFVFGRISGRHFRVFPADNFFLVSTSSLEKETLREFPKLSSVSITRRFPDRILVSVTERDRMLMWCSGGPCVLVEDDGVARDAGPAETLKNEPFLLRVVDTSARPVDIGMPILTPEETVAILRLERGLRERSGIGFSPVFASPSRVSDEIRITTDEGWDILAGLDIDPDKTILSLQLVLDKEIPVEKRSVLRYVDLRTENRAFFASKDADGGQEGDVTDGTAVDRSDAAIPVLTGAETDKKK
ncbi:MAG TPA: FtsQ-type POTRA domain-containing protein [Candidatus Fimivivens sp.]|nr:FtsQ-type POTRA domain-containing protein [Candidatus Fimivivens sp.]